MKGHLFFVLVTLTLIFSSPALAAEFHVTNADQLISALDAAGANGADDIIYLAAGTYHGNFRYTHGEAGNLTIKGEPGTSAADVVLDGALESDGIGLLLTHDSGTYNASIEGLTIQHGTQSGILVRVKNSGIHLTLNRVIIQNNTTQDKGGGIKLDVDQNGSADVKILHSIIRYNQAPGNSAGRLGRGGGVYATSCYGNSVLDLLVVNTLFYRNQANWSGGGINFDACEVGDNNITRGKIINSTITGNLSNMHGTGSEKGGGVWVKTYSGNGALASLDLYNSIVYGNTSGGGGPGQDLHVTQSNPGLSTVNAYNCDINDIGGDMSLYHTTNVINSDPLFVDSLNDNYHLTPDSPCIDAGTTSVPSPPGLPGTDFEDNARIAGPFPDIGAYEYVGLQVKPGEGTIGTVLDITGSEFGAKRGKVSVGTSALKIIKWTMGWIQASLTKALPPGAYGVKIEPKGTDPIILEGGFTSMPSVIDSVEPASGSVNDEVTLRGQFFGTKRGKVTLGGKNCRLMSWTMNASTGTSEVRFVVPRGLSAGPHELKIINGVGSDTIEFETN